MQKSPGIVDTQILCAAVNFANSRFCNAIAYKLFCNLAAGCDVISHARAYVKKAYSDYASLKGQSLR